MASRAEAQTIYHEIQLIQKSESEKLVLVAAKHLDVIRQNLPALSTHMGLTGSTDGKYTDQKVAELIDQIQNSLENIQSIKCDLLDSDNSVK